MHVVSRPTFLAALVGGAIALAPASAGAETLARWQFDEGSGQVAGDSSGHGHDGQLGSGSGADVSDPSWIPGRVGSALRFDGTRDQYVVIAGAASISPAHITVSAWVRRLGTPGSYRYVISNGARACDESSYGLYSGAGGGLSFYVSDAAGHVLSPAAGADRVWDGAWHLATGTYDGSAVRLYIDDKQVTSGVAASLTIDYPGGGSAYIGTFRGNCDLPFTGDLDDLAIDAAALSASAIAQLFAATPPPPAQVAPVGAPGAPTGTPAGPGSASKSGATSAAPSSTTTSAPSCASIKVSRRSIRVGRRTTVAVTVRVGRALAGRRTVTVSGGGMRISARTGRKTGRATLALRPRRKGTLRVALKGQARTCAAPTIATR